MPQRFTGVLMETSATFKSGFPEISISETVLSETEDPDPVWLPLPIGTGVLTHVKKSSALSVPSMMKKSWGKKDICATMSGHIASMCRR